MEIKMVEANLIAMALNKDSALEGAKVKVYDNPPYEAKKALDAKEEEAMISIMKAASISSISFTISTEDGEWYREVERDLKEGTRNKYDYTYYTLEDYIDKYDSPSEFGFED